MEILFCFKRLSDKFRSIPFKTGEKAFDSINEASGTLEEYFIEDVSGSGDYITFLFVEDQNENKDNIVHGLVRFKEVSKEIFYDILEQISIPKKVKYNIKKDIQDYKTKIIYLSRIGIQEHEKKKRIGSLIAKFFDFLMFQETDNIVIYAKVLKNLDIFLSGPYITIGQGEDDHWGDFLVKYRVLFH